MKKFNVSGKCNPAKHYMVDITDRLEYMKELIDDGEYFCINRSRQYGKTTTINELTNYLSDDYIIISLDFQQIDSEDYSSSEAFITSLIRLLKENLQKRYLENCTVEKYLEDLDLFLVKEKIKISSFFDVFIKICNANDKYVVLIIDEVDRISNNDIFLDILGQLRARYLKREKSPTFQSVILAGVYDVETIKYKIRPANDHRMNSPWNIASQFDYDMSLHTKGISLMLDEYSADKALNFDTEKIAQLIYDYTNGYPYLVSKICSIIDRKTNGLSWNSAGVKSAVKLLLSDTNNMLFNSLNNKLNDYPELKDKLKDILFQGISYSYNQFDYSIKLATMFGFIRNDNGSIAIDNRIFEIILYNMLLANGENKTDNMFYACRMDKNQFIDNGDLNLERVLEKFIQHFDEIYGDQDKSFLEDEGRRFFLLYLRPIINGTGHYYIEARTRNLERTDVIVDYNGKQYIIELKIWRGDSYNKRGEQQLANYLDYYGIDKGYMLSFNFNKSKSIGIHEIKLGHKTIIEAVV